MKEFNSLLETIRVLRSPKGCPWDRVQTAESMKKHLLEEVYEFIDGVDKNDIQAIREELGDILLILVVVSEIFGERNEFTIADVLKQINEKLISRHPHVFSTIGLKTKEEVLQYWIKDKAKKKKRKSIKDRLPLGSPALLMASILFKEHAHLAENRAKENEGVLLSKIRAKLDLLKDSESKEELLGDMLLHVCEFSSFFSIDLEGVLRKVILKKAEGILYD